MSQPRIKISKRTKQVLEEVAPGRYHLESGSRHIRVFIDNAFVAILPRIIRGDGRDSGRGEINAIAAIRRAAKEVRA